MREEIDEWVAEGRQEAQSDRPLVLLDVVGVVAEVASESSEEEPEERIDLLQVPDHMPDLIAGLCAVADVWWMVDRDDDLLDELAERLGTGPLRAVGSDEFGMVESAARALLWKASSAGRTTYRIEHFGGEIPPRLPDKTVLIDTAPDTILRPAHLPSELRRPD